jgi:anti-sigma regulatory factor (Ser/Thr protein kinase)
VKRGKLNGERESAEIGPREEILLTGLKPRDGDSLNEGLAPGSGDCFKGRRMHEGSITINVAADVREIERLNKLVRQFGELHDVPSRSLYAVNLALDELVTNVILYGFDAAEGKHVVVKIHTTAGELTASVIDEGKAFDPLQSKTPDINAPLEERDLGGLGIHLVRSLMDNVSYQRDGDKNVLTVRKRIR